MCRCAESRKGTRLAATDVGLPKPYARRANPGSEGPEPRPGSRAREDSAAPLFQELRARRAARFLSLTTCTRLQVYRKYSAWSCRWLFETWIRKNKRNAFCGEWQIKEYQLAGACELRGCECPAMLDRVAASGIVRLLGEGRCSRSKTHKNVVRW